MIHLQETHSGLEINLPTEWSEITLSKAEEVYRCASNLPDYIKDAYPLRCKERTPDDENHLKILFDKITDKDHIKVLPKIYGELIEILAGLSFKDVNKISGINRTILYDTYIERFVIGLLMYPDYEHKGIEYFTHGKSKYYLPLMSEGFGFVVPGVDMVAADFAAASDLEVQAKELEGGRWEVAPLIIAILCRKKEEGKREEYNEQVSLLRASKFTELTMDVVLEVFFCLAQLSNTYKSISQALVAEAQQRVQN